MGMPGFLMFIEDILLVDFESEGHQNERRAISVSPLILTSDYPQKD